jgi:hypothetical protein
MDSLPSVLWDYSPVAPSTIALIISVIAIWNPFSGENKWVKRCAIGVAAVGIVATIGIRHHELEVSEQERQNTQVERKKAEERLTTLGQLITEGDALQATNLRDKEAPVNMDGVNAWTKKTEEFLSNELGGAFVDRFRDASGLPSLTQPISFFAEGIGGPHTQVWALMINRLARLQQFSQEVSARIR